MAEDDDLDVEAIQAQVDLAMSFTHDLVSSWVKPPETSPKTRDFDKELKEYMRRPPRLGVGASVPESNPSSSRDAARLMGRLIGKGKKRERTLRDDNNPQLDSTDNEDESRSGAIKQKARQDWFTDVLDSTRSKKRAKIIQDDSKPPTKPAPLLPFGNAIPEFRQESGKMEVDTTEASTSSPGKKKKKKKKKHDLGTSGDGGLASDRMVIDPVTSALQGNTPLPVLFTAPTSPSSARRDKLLPAMLKHPVLVLDGPLNPDGVEAPTGSPKRKRRRKKKKLAGTDGGID